MSYTSKPDRTNRRGRQIQRAIVNNSSNGGPVRTPAGRKAVVELRDLAAKSRGNVGVVRARVAETLAGFDLNDFRLHGLDS